MNPVPPSAAVDPRALIDATTEPLYAVDAAGRILAWNWGAESLYGYGRAEAIGRNVHELVCQSEGDRGTLAALREAVETGSAFVATTRRTKDGSVLHVQSMMRPVRGPDGALLFVAVGERDISEQKRLEEELWNQVWSLTDVQALLQSVMDGSKDYAIVAMDLEAKIQAWNEGARREYGYEATEATGRDGKSLLFAAEDVRSGRVAAALAKALAMETFVEEFEVARKDGSAFPARISLDLRKDPYGKPMGFVAIVKNILQERRAEEQRRVALERLLEIQRLKEMDQFRTRLLNTASHELNTPLTPIRLQLHLFKNTLAEGLNERQTKAIQVLDRNFEWLSRMVRDMLDVALLQGGRLQLHPEPVDLHGHVAQAVDTYRETARVAGVGLEWQEGEACPVEVDPVRLTQVLSNLLDNAIKFTPGSGTVHVATNRVGSTAVVTIRDTGVGLTKDQIQRLFQPFAQVHDTMQRTRAGSGLGLYICRELVQDHGGKVWCESPGPGKGATFAFSLPLRTDATAHPQARAAKR